jgi:hypothetical protein
MKKTISLIGDISEAEIRKAMDAGSKLPSNLTVTTAFLSKIDSKVKKLFRYILADYRHRFKVQYYDYKINIAFCGIDPANAPNSYFGVTVDTEDRIFVQVEDPHTDTTVEEDVELHLYARVKFLENLCHEMTHVCQNLIDPKKSKKKWPSINHNSKDPEQAYFFDKYEIEARIMEGFYANKYAIPLFLAKDKTLKIN